MTFERHRPKSFWRRVERWAVGIAMALMAFVIERMVVRSVRKAEAGKPKPGVTEELHTTLTSKGGDVDLTDLR